MKHTPIKNSFQYPDIPTTAFRFGSGELIGIPLNENGDWRNFVPPPEKQNRRGIESSACYIHAQQKSLAIIQEEQFNLPDRDYAERFNALLSGGTEYGGDPIKGAQSIRHDGLIPDKMMPFSDIITSWDRFHSWWGVEEKDCREEGQNWLKQWTPKYDIVFTKDEPIENKYIKMKTALKYSPLAVSVCAWYEDNGLYIKPQGARDNHMVVLLYIDELNRPHIWDTYEPYTKTLTPNYDMEFCLRYSLRRNLSTTSWKDFWFIDILKRIWGFIKSLWT